MAVIKAKMDRKIKVLNLIFKFELLKWINGWASLLLKLFSIPDIHFDKGI